MTTSITSITITRVDDDDIVALALGGRIIPGRHGIVADVRFASGARQIIDHLDSEPSGVWQVNGYWPAGSTSCPLWWNGNLSRCTARTLAAACVVQAVAVAIAEGAS